MRILALDIGSSSVKAGLWNGRAFSATARVPFPTCFQGNTAEIDAATLLRAVMGAGDRVLAGSSAIDAIAYCTFSSGVIVTDRHLQPLMPIITHADRRSTATALSLVQRRPRSWWLARTGNLPYPGGIGGSTLAWLREHQPGLFRRSYRVGQVSSFIGSVLTAGAWQIDPSQAVFLGLWDIHRDRWNTDACALVGISPESLPECRWADEPLGGLSPALARRWNVTAGLPVLGGFVDTSAAVIQTPMAAGQLAHNAGSTDVLALCVDRPCPAAGILSRPVGVSARWGARAASPKWLAVRTIASAGSALEWIRKMLFPGTSQSTWRTLIARACKDLQLEQPEPVQCIPSFAGERATLIQPAGASLTGIRLDTQPREILESVVRALVRQSTENYRILASIHPPQKTVYAMGGASTLGDAMHAHWPANHAFRRLAGDSLRGLALLAERVL